MTRQLKWLLAFHVLLLLSITGIITYSNDFYNHGSFPAPGSPATSAGMRAELDLISGGFDKLPTLTGNASKAVIVNGGATALGLTTGTLTLPGNFALSGANAVTLTSTGSTNVTLPTTGTLATLAGTETLTGKTVNLTSNTLTGTLTQFNTALSDADFVTLAGAETLTTKTVNLASNTLTGTVAQFNTALSDGDFATLAGAESLSNKTLPSPVLSGTVTGTYTLGGTPTITSTAAASGLTMNTARLLGRTTASAGAIEELTVGASLTLAGGSLSGTAASETQAGVVELATQAEVDAMTDTGRVVTPNHNKLVLATPIVASGTTVDFTNIPSGVRRIEIMFQSVSLSGTNQLLLSIGDAGGLESSGYTSSSSQIPNGAFPGTLNSTAGFVINIAQAAAFHSGAITLSLSNATDNTWAAHGVLGAATAITITIGGHKSLSAVLDRLRIAPTGADTFDNGSINISYER